MSGFVGKVEEPSSEVIPRSGFWPSIDLSEFRSDKRVLNSISAEQAKTAVINALVHVINQLNDYEAKQVGLGYLILEDVPSREIAGANQNILLFEKAVFSKAKSTLLEEYRDMDLARKAGEDKAEQSASNIQTFQAECFIAIRNLKGKTGVYAELV